MCSHIFNAKYSTTLTVSGNSTDFTISLQPPIYLDPTREYVASFLSLMTYNSIPNITENNNVFKYSADNGNTWNLIHLPVDAYEYNQIVDEIKRQMIQNDNYENEPIKFSICRLSSLIEITQDSYKIDFGVLNSIGATLGFTNEVLSKGVHKSPKIVDISKINSILINVDFIEGGYVNKTKSFAIHNFFPTAGPGYKIIEQPSPELIFYRVTKNFIPSIKLWLTDQNGNLLNLQGERVTVTILIKEI